MSRIMRLYYYGVLGGIGGLAGWQISNLTGLSFTGNLYLSEVVVGALVGFAMGAMIGITEGLITRNLYKVWKAALFSGLLGLAGGAVGLPLAEGIFQLLGGQVWGRPLGWAVFGLVTGVAVSITGGAQMWKGAAGGFVGGLLGGAYLEAARWWLANALVGKAAGMILLGASVGVCIALIVFMLSRAWLEVVSGKLKGTEFILDKFLHESGPSAFIGSSALKSDIVLPDPDISPQHAILKGVGTHFTLKDISLAGTFINHRRIELTRLSNNQTITVGNTDLVYHEKR